MSTETSTPVHSPEVLYADSSRLVIVDVQEKLLPAMFDARPMLAACRLLIEGAKLFSVPTVATEQYPQGLGETTAELRDLLPHRAVKQEFSSWPALGWPTAAADPAGRFQVVVAGIESHVCVLQTALELQSAGYRVFVVADAVTSRRVSDKQFALERMQTAGITVMTAESVVFEWCQRSDRPEFKPLSKLVKQRPV